MNKIASSVIVAILSVSAGWASAASTTDDLPTKSDQTSAQKSADIHLQLAIELYQSRKYSAALDEIKLTLKATPDFADALSMRGLIYMDMGETARADESFQAALKINPKRGDFNNNYGWFLCQNGHPAESIPYFEAAVKLRTYESPGRAMDNAGMCSLKLNNTEAADKYFLEAFRFEPGNPKVNFNLANMYYHKQDYDHAKFHIGLAIKAGLLDANALWLGIKIAHKMGDRVAEGAYGSQLQQLQPGSAEYAAYQREAFDE